MLFNEQMRREATDRQIATEFDWLQQTFNRWKAGSLPRPHMYPSIAKFLKISVDMVTELVEEAVVSQSTTKLPKAVTFNSARVYGKVTDRKAGKYGFEAYNQGRRHIPEGRYCILIETKVMEPALVVGTKAWLDPGVWPQVGNDVLVHSAGGAAWIGRLAANNGATADLERHAGPPVTVRDVKAIHVIVLAERVAN